MMKRRLGGSGNYRERSEHILKPNLLRIVMIVGCILICLDAALGNPVEARAGLTATSRKRSFTVADDIGLAVFLNPDLHGQQIIFAPNGRYFMALTERGSLALDAPEDTIWVFKTDAVRGFLQHHEESQAPTPIPIVRMASYKDGPIISQVRWLQDSSGIAFLAVRKSNKCRFHQLLVVDIDTQALKAMTPDDQDVSDYDIVGDNFVYEVNAPVLLTSPPEEDQKEALPLTGKMLDSIILTAESHQTPFDAAGLWAVIDGKRFQVKDTLTHRPNIGNKGLSLSPDGRYVASIAPADHAPESWARYKAPPGYEGDTAPSVLAYHLTDLQSGARKLLVNAPSGRHKDWNSHLFTARWSADSKSILLSNTFLPLDVKDAGEIAQRESHPCVALMRLPTQELTCVLPVKAGLDKNRYALSDIRFEDKDHIVLVFDRSYYFRGANPSAVMSLKADGSWSEVPGEEDPRMRSFPLRLEVHQDIDHSPVIAAEDKTTHAVRPIWDPNPQLKNIETGQAEIISGKDAFGLAWEGGLVKPSGYVPGRRYPLVIQTHGFFSGTYLSSGTYNSATFAARALAACGIMVLQLGWNQNVFNTPEEGRAEVAVFESAVEKLNNAGMIDPARVGVIGFSRTVYHAIYALTTTNLFAAASVTDGVTFGYFDYLKTVELEKYTKGVERVYGGRPFNPNESRGWIERAPSFNMSKVESPLLVMSAGKASLWSDWEPYAALRLLHKPVDLIMLPSGTHVMTNPRQRLAAETTNVDWFRFWLIGEEDTDPAKAEQYARWRELRKMEPGATIQALPPDVNE